MFPVLINDGIQKIPDDNIYYIIGKNGIFLHKKLSIIESTIPVNNISILEEIFPYAKLNIPKLPRNLFAKTVSFFNEVCKQHHGAESMVLIFYDPKTKKFDMIAPKQTVSGGMISEYERLPNFNDFIKIGTIHSHGLGSAFHSSIDQNDEESFDGLHITVGSFGNYDNDNCVSLSTSLMVNKNRFIIPSEEYISGIIRVEEPINSEEIQPRAYNYSLKNDMFIVLENNNFPKEWIENINSKTQLIKTKIFNWKEFFADKKPHIQIIEDFELTGEDENIPCLQCPFRDIKSDLLLFGLDSEEWEKDDWENKGIIYPTKLEGVKSI